MAPGARGLVDRQLVHLRVVGLIERQFDVALVDRGDLVAAPAHQPRGRGKRHLLAQHQHLEQQREPRELARPRRLDLAHRAVGQLDPGHTDLQEALMLEEVQMQVALGHRVVDRVLAIGAEQRKAAARAEIDLDRQRARQRIEPSLAHVPRGLDPEGRFEQFLCHRLQPELGRGCRASRLNFNRGSFWEFRPSVIALKSSGGANFWSFAGPTIY